MRRCTGVVFVALAIALGTSAASAAKAAPKLFASGPQTTGLKNVTSFAFGAGAIFAGDSGNSSSIPNGGVYVIKHGAGVEIPNSPIFVGGMTWNAGALYLSGGVLKSGGAAWEIMRWSGWNGYTFKHRKVLYTAPKGFQGFNGVAFGPDGRLYVGVDTGLLNNNDHGPATISPFVYDILSMTAGGKSVKVFAKGIRQPWQLAFAPNSDDPFVSDLGQDSGVLNPPDFVLRVRKGDNYGFPACTWVSASQCKKDAKPFKTFSPHTNPMGLTVVGKRLYIGTFNGSLLSMPVTGGKVTTVLTGIPAATDALAYSGGYLYIGGQANNTTGVVYRVKP